jgi:hypothetical protein
VDRLALGVELHGMPSSLVVPCKVALYEVAPYEVVPHEVVSCEVARNEVVAYEVDRL